MPPTLGLRKKLGWRSRSSRQNNSDGAVTHDGGQAGSSNLVRSGLTHDKVSSFSQSTDTLVPQDPSSSRLRSTGGATAASYASSAGSSEQKDPVGLHIVHNPPSGPKAHIVFVHGLGGASRQTWTKNKDSGLFWPGAFLPLEDDIAQARILSFGYNADVRNAGSRSSVIDFAKDLLYELKYAKDDQGKDLEISETPLIFIAHSMGGLIVKEGQHNPDFVDIAKAVTAIIFLSTPHRGSNFADTLNRIIQVSFVGTPKKYISELARNSHTVQNINEQFRHLAPKLHIVSFYETQTTPVGPTKSKIMVVERDSSVLGYPGEISKGLDANHFTVCKYESRQDPSYVAVRNYLKSNVAKLLSTRGSKASISTASTTLDSRDLDRLIGACEPPDTDYIFFRDRWVEGTCEWILEEDAFSRWLDDPSDSPQMLWIHGVPGSGKSVLSSFIVNELAEQGRICQYIFVKSSDQMEDSLGSILSSIAFQMAQSYPSFRQALNKAVRAQGSKLTDPRLIWQRIFRTILAKQEFSMPIYWVIDGLQDCDDPRGAIKMLSEILSLCIPVRLLISSRRTPSIEAEMSKHGSHLGFSTIALDDLSADYRTFLNDALDWAEIPNFKERMIPKLLDMAQGSFLWLSLTVERLNACYTEQAVAEALKELPSGMESLYDQMAISLEDQSPMDKSLRTSIMTWAACAHRSISVLELEEALQPGGHQVLSLQRSIHALCAGFVIIDNDGMINVIHQTAREYLLKSNGKYSLLQRPSAHEIIALRCLGSLTTPGLRSKVLNGQAPSLLTYASRTWFAHLKYCNPESHEILSAIISFLRGPNILTWIFILARDGHIATLLEASSHLAGFVRTLRRLQSSKSWENRRQEDTGLVQHWSIDLDRLAGRFGTQLSTRPDSIFAMIPPFCPKKSMINQQFARNDDKSITITDSRSLSDWNDTSARISLPADYQAISVLAEGPWIAIVAKFEFKGRIIVYRTGTHQRLREFEHKERIRTAQFSPDGSFIVSIGLRTTKVWEIQSGSLLTEASNPSARPRPHATLFLRGDEMILIATEERRIWSMSTLDRPRTAVEQKQYIIEATGPNDPFNCPMCSALSPDGQRVAYGYRSGPLTVWDINTPELLVSSRELTKVSQIVWHPDPYVEEVFGIMVHLAGRVFKWSLFSNFEPLSYYIEGHCMSISHTGALLAVGDHHGNIKLLSTMDLTMVYYISTQDRVIDLIFSTDDRQLYDLRETHVNIWESVALFKLVDSQSELDGSAYETNPVAEKDTNGEPTVTYGRVDPITAMAAQEHHGRLYCTGTQSGEVVVHSLDSEEPFQVDLLLRCSILELVWDDEGSQVCYTDASRTVNVCQIPAKMGSGASYTTQRIALTVKQLPDCINHLLFHPGNNLLLVSCNSASVVVSLQDEKALSVASINAIGRWVRQPFDPDLILLVSHSSIRTFAWDSLEQRGKVDLDPTVHPYSTHGDSHDAQLDVPETRDQLQTEFHVQGAFISPSKQHLFVQVANAQGHTMVRLLSLEKDGTSVIGTRLRSVDLPTSVVHRIDRPLRFLTTALGLDVLVFLDCDSWLCTWNIFGDNSKGVIAHYCLPGDWVSPECVSLYRLLDDGTLLCPKNGDIAAVRCPSIGL